MHADRRAPLRVAHRGGSALAPENTLAAFRHALTCSIDAFELDVQMSRDGHPIVFHDETVERLTDGQGNILDLDRVYLDTLNAAEHFPGGWPGIQRIPLLSDVLNMASQARVKVLIEIKTSRRDGVTGRYPLIVEKVAQEVERCDVLGQAQVISFDWQALSRIKDLLPGIETGVLFGQEVGDLETEVALVRVAAYAEALRCAWIHLDDQLFRPEMPAFFHTNGLQLGIWTVNDRDRMDYLTEAGVDSLTTDRPDLFT